MLFARRLKMKDLYLFLGVGVGMLNKKYILSAILMIAHHLNATTISVSNSHGPKPIVNIDENGNITVDINLASATSPQGTIQNTNTIINNNTITATSKTTQIEESVQQLMRNTNSPSIADSNSDQRKKEALINMAYGALAMITYMKMPPLVILTFI